MKNLSNLADKQLDTLFKTAAKNEIFDFDIKDWQAMHKKLDYEDTKNCLPTENNFYAFLKYIRLK